MVISIAKVKIHHTLDIAHLMSQTMSLHDNGNESFTVHSTINMKWAYNHIDP
jgi:hypothetical protein